MTKKILIIIAPINYRDEEYEQPRKVFEENGYAITVASKRVSEATGSIGGRTPIDMDIEDVKPADYDGIVFVGGPGATIYFNDETVLNLAKQAKQLDKVVGAICIAPSILANAGVLNGKKATSFPSEQDNITKNGGTYTQESVTVDGKIVTADGPNSAQVFGEKIVEVLG